MSRRAFTLVELMFVTIITAIIVGALGGLFVFVGTRASQTITKNGILLQTQALNEELERVLSQAQECKLVQIRVGVNGLKCTLPAAGVDADADGTIDKYRVSAVGPRGREAFGTGKRVWFYMADATGAPATGVTSGGTLWRAWRNDDALPTLADADQKFAYYYGDTGKPRWNFVDSLGYTINANGTVTYTIASSKLRRAERRPGAGESTANYESFRITRTVVCKYWRK